MFKKTAFKEEHQEIREAVGKLCLQFPGKYWRDLDERRWIPICDFLKGRAWNDSDPKQRIRDGYTNL